VGKLKLDLIADINRFNYLDSINNLRKTEVDFILTEVLTGTRDKLNGPEEYGIGRGTVYYITLKKPKELFCRSINIWVIRMML